MRPPRKQQPHVDPEANRRSFSDPRTPSPLPLLEVAQVSGGDAHAPGKLALRDPTVLAKAANPVSDEEVDAVVGVGVHDQTLAVSYRRVKGADIDTMVGRRVAEERSKIKMSQRALAAKMDIAGPHLSNLEKGLRGWTCAQLVRAADAMGIDPCQLLTQPAGLDPTEHALVMALRSSDPVSAAVAFSAALAQSLKGKAG